MSQIRYQAIVKSKRPVNLDLTTIKFPITAIVSITHRVTGVLSIFGVLILFWMFDRSLRTPETFVELSDCLSNPLMKLTLWGVLAAFAWHFCMGIRHLIMDLGFLESLEGGRASAKVAIGLAAFLVLVALVGVL